MVLLPHRIQSVWSVLFYCHQEHYMYRVLGSLLTKDTICMECFVLFPPRKLSVWSAWFYSHMKHCLYRVLSSFAKRTQSACFYSDQRCHLHVVLGFIPTKETMFPPITLFVSLSFGARFFSPQRTLSPWGAWFFFHQGKHLHGVLGSSSTKKTICMGRLGVFPPRKISAWSTWFYCYHCHFLHVVLHSILNKDTICM